LIFIEKLTVYNICCVDEEISNILDLLLEGAQWVGLESEPRAPCHKSSTAVRTISQWLPNKMLATLSSYDKIMLHKITTKPPVTIIDFDIWNFSLWCTLGTIKCCLHRCGASFLYDSLWHHKLPRHHIHNKPIRVRGKCTF